MAEEQFYYSPDHGHRLVFSERVPLLTPEGNLRRTRSIVTVEDYSKWYSLYYVTPDGIVYACVPLEPDDAPPRMRWVAQRTGVVQVPTGDLGTVAGDHCWNPNAVVKMARRRGFDIDERSLEIIAGRWFIEHLNLLTEELP